MPLNTLPAKKYRLQKKLVLEPLVSQVAVDEWRRRELMRGVCWGYVFTLVLSVIRYGNLDEILQDYAHMEAHGDELPELIESLRQQIKTACANAKRRLPIDELSFIQKATLTADGVQVELTDAGKQIARQEALVEMVINFQRTQGNQLLGGSLSEHYFFQFVTPDTQGPIEPFFTYFYMNVKPLSVALDCLANILDDVQNLHKNQYAIMTIAAVDHITALVRDTDNKRWVLFDTMCYPYVTYTTTDELNLMPRLCKDLDDHEHRCFTMRGYAPKSLQGELQHRASLEETNPDWQTSTADMISKRPQYLLYHAAVTGHEKLVRDALQHYLRHGRSLYSQFFLGHILYSAATYGHSRVVEELWKQDLSAFARIDALFMAKRTNQKALEQQLTHELWPDGKIPEYFTSTLKSIPEVSPDLESGDSIEWVCLILIQCVELDQQKRRNLKPIIKLYEEKKHRDAIILLLTLVKDSYAISIALNYAASAGDVPITRLLLDTLLKAITNDKVSMAAFAHEFLIISSKSDVAATTLLQAAAKEHEEIFQELIKVGAYAPHELLEKALAHAARRGELEATGTFLTLLIKQTIEGLSPANQEREKREFAQVLLMKEQDPEVRKIILLAAVLNSHWETVHRFTPFVKDFETLMKVLAVTLEKDGPTDTTYIVIRTILPPQTSSPSRAERLQRISELADNNPKARAHLVDVAQQKQLTELAELLGVDLDDVSQIKPLALQVNPTSAQAREPRRSLESQLSLFDSAKDITFKTKLGQLLKKRVSPASQQLNEQCRREYASACRNHWGPRANDILRSNHAPKRVYSMLLEDKQSAANNTPSDSELRHTTTTSTTKPLSSR